MKALHLLPALAMVLITATPALAHGNGNGRGWGRQDHGHWQQAPVHAGQGHGRWQKAPVRYVPVVQPVYTQPCPAPVVVTRQVPVYVPARPVVYQQVPVRQRRHQQPGASVVFRVNL